MRRISLIGLSFAFCLILLAACSNPKPTGQETTGSAANNPQSEAPGNELTEQDMKLGQLAIGQTMDKVRELLGEPSEETIAHGIGDPEWIYKDKGLEIDGGGYVWGIHATSPFSGVTPRNIGIGSTVDEVKKAYPAIETSALDEGILIQKSTDNKYMLQFSIKDDKVAFIVLVQDLVIK